MIFTGKPAEKTENEHSLELKDPNELNKHTCFTVMLPSYLPENYKFTNAKLHKREDGSVSDKYIDLFFTNSKTGKYIYMQQRSACDEMSFASGTDGKIEKVKVNGIDAVISDDRSIDWEPNNVIYGLSGRGSIGKSELIKIAESIKIPDKK